MKHNTITMDHNYDKLSQASRNEIERLQESNIGLLEACKQLLLHRAEGDIHPIDFQRIRLAIEKAEGRTP